ncbi:elongation factor P maturation arginine rhamnosyltransferase EarP [Shewanella sp. NIFS-20-20]|uniref:elongation factor P maturation arginine rhamnosyltransferase EarP n=1 Tax=Shewanella sp. NIFS-20-20 TaxID=2853806 RepID=UPI001C443776|nr:elongation factor P maturation arginine rhamnosyltransferase EarP [Shewanella sp. NIFS-20-20]MBV7315197.1 elongation factor P maturation arginine rhamnosyltransferase EarP [Shewanella sp. NIFS-20-20]
MNHVSAPHWDIFCTVVDNYGDIGVTWRLAKQLTCDYQLPVNLWVDDLQSFSHILPELDPSLARQVFNGVSIHQWNCPLDIPYEPGQVLIEAFACELPDIVKQSLLAVKQSRGTPPLWLNLEYLSAESWVEGCHGLPSLQANGLKKYFYFPGFTAKTGGLICENALFDERDQWQADPQHKLALFRQLGLSGIEADDTVISVFSYESAALLSLCHTWQHADHHVHALIPKGRSLHSLLDILPCTLEQLVCGQQFSMGNLTVHILPMTDQQTYDRLLWSCDFNIVRGEDSFIRAQWAAKPFIWHIYPQEDDYHLVKLEAFMQLYCDNLPPEIAELWQALTLSFNQEQQAAVSHHWQQLNLVSLPLLQHAKQWPNDALNAADLASRLVQFVENS